MRRRPRRPRVEPGGRPPAGARGPGGAPGSEGSGPTTARRKAKTPATPASGAGAPAARGDGSGGGGSVIPPSLPAGQPLLGGSAPSTPTGAHGRYLDDP